MRSLNLQDTFFFIILIAVTIGFLYIIGPFIMDIFMAFILIILFKRPFNYFIKKFKGNRNKASIVSLIIVLFVFIIPLFFIGLLISTEIGSTYTAFTDNWPKISAYIKEIPNRANDLPYIKNYINDINWNEIAQGMNKIMTTVASFVFTLIQTMFINVGILFIHFFIVMFLLYYLFIDGKELVKRIQYIIPIKDSDEREMFDKMEKVTDALILNTFLIGISEGIYGAVLYAILGVSSPFFWGLIMAFLSIIPLVGANSIHVPMAIFQFIIGNVWTGIFILIFGVGVIIINQNIIRPRLDGNKSGMHPAIMFLSSMGGLVLIGVAGFLAGPIITALFLVIWHQFGEKYKTKLEMYNKDDDVA